MPSNGNAGFNAPYSQVPAPSAPVALHGREVYSKAFFVDRDGRHFGENYPQIHRFAAN
jgi:hypothetical protein